MTRVLLDTREEEHPVPLERAVAAFNAADKQSVVIMIHRKNPLPLFAIIEARGGRWQSREIADNLYHILLTKDPDMVLEEIDV